MTNKVIHPEGWAPALGYANGILTESGTLYTGGQIGWDKNKIFVCDEFVPQMRQALQNILAIVEAAGGTAADVVRLTWFVTDKTVYLETSVKLGEPIVIFLVAIFRQCQCWWWQV